MAQIARKPLRWQPHRAFNSANEAYALLQDRPMAFTWHMHVPLTPEHEEAAMALRSSLLDILNPDVHVSIPFPPQGPHINAPYYTVYFPGALLNVVKEVLAHHKNAPVMLHPLTGHQYAEHHAPLAAFFGPAMPDVFDDEKLKAYDRAKGIDPVLAVR